MKAIINGDRIECGKCGMLLSKFQKINPAPQNPDDRFIKGVEIVFDVPQRGNEYIGGHYDLNDPNYEHPRYIFEIKCKHKDKGQYCNEVNSIEL